MRLATRAPPAFGSTRPSSTLHVAHRRPARRRREDLRHHGLGGDGLAEDLAEISEPIDLGHRVSHHSDLQAARRTPRKLRRRSSGMNPVGGARLFASAGGKLDEDQLSCRWSTRGWVQRPSSSPRGRQRRAWRVAGWTSWGFWKWSRHLLHSLVGAAPGVRSRKHSEGALARRFTADARRRGAISVRLVCAGCEFAKREGGRGVTAAGRRSVHGERTAW